MIRVPPATIGLLLLARAACAQALPFGAIGGEGAARAGPLVGVTLRFDRAAAGTLEILRFVTSERDPHWRLEEMTSQLVGSENSVVVNAPSGVDTLLALRHPGRAGYVLEGPFRWPGGPATRVVAMEWRRTIRGRFPGERGAIGWVDRDFDRRSTRWPSCDWLDDEVWECMGVPLLAAGVIVLHPPGTIAFGFVPRVLVQSGGSVETVAVERAAWGRLAIVSVAVKAGDAGTPEVLGSARRLAGARARTQSTRFETESDPRVRVSQVDERVFWVSGTDAVADGWVEFGARGAAPERLDVREIAAESPELPVMVRLSDAVSISGRVVSSDGTGAPDAVVALYRLVVAGAGEATRRIAVGEMRSLANGEFVFDDLGPDRYQVLAVHPAFGRGERPADGGEREIEIRLRPPPQIVGRIVRHGTPAPGVPVAVVPDIAQFATSADVTELRGGDGRTDKEGRFRVAAAMKGAGELRVGDDRSGIRRIPLPAAESLPPLLNIGSVEMGEAPAMTLVLEGSDGCELLLTGPAGRLSLTTTRARRVGPAMYEASVPEPGSWQVVAICGSRERPVVPGVVQFVPGSVPRSIRLTWPIR